MNKTTMVQPDKMAGFLPSNRGILQRKCACGNHTIAGGECVDCAKKKMGLQRKLTIGASNDPLEQEADRIADQVMVAPGHSAVSGTPVKVQRFTGNPSGQTAEVPASVERVLASPGRPLEPALRQDMEGRFGHDFSRVRIHTGGLAEQSAREVDANAYTVGNNIVFGVGQYSPGLQGSTQLLAHELTHVMQQSKSSEVRDIIQRQVDTVEESDEVYDPRREILSLGAFSRHYPAILRTFNNLDVAMDELHWAVERYGPQGFGFAELQSRYARARSRWEEANTLLDQYWSIARVMVAVGRAGEVLVVVNDMRRAQGATTRVGFGVTPEFSLLTRPHQHALTARSRINAALAEREETRRVHEVVAEEIEREHTATQEREIVSRERTIAQTASELRSYVRTNYPAITEENNRLRFALAFARLLHANLGNATTQYIELFTRLESENSEFYTLVLFRGATISYLADMGVEGLEIHVYREANRSGAHILFGAWNFDETTGEERDSATWLLLLDVLIGIVPVVGQITDVRDISGYIYRMGKYPAQRDSTLTRIGLAAAILGLIPVVGDGAKSLLAAIRRVAVDLPVGRLSDDIVSGVARYLDAGTLQRIVDTSDNFSRTLTMRWTVIQGNVLNIWDEIVAEMGPALTRVSNLTIAELNLVREAASQYLPETLQRIGIWLGQLVRSFWVLAKLSLRHEAEDIIDMIRAYREQWRLTSRAAHELWSPTARFLAHLTPAERAAVRIRLLALAARESDEIMQGVRRLLDDTPESVPAPSARVVEATPSPIRPRVDEPPVAESAAARTVAAETSPTSTAPDSISSSTELPSAHAEAGIRTVDLDASVARSSHRDGNLLTPEEIAAEAEYVGRHPELVEGTPGHQHARLSDEHEIVEVSPGFCERHSNGHLPVACPPSFIPASSATTSLALARAFQRIRTTQSRTSFMRYARLIIDSDPDHPLRFLLQNGRLRGGWGMTHSELMNNPFVVQAGHRDSSWWLRLGGGGGDRLAIQWAWANQIQNTILESRGGASLDEPVVLIGGIPVMLETALMWVRASERYLAQAIVDAAPRL